MTAKEANKMSRDYVPAEERLREIFVNIETEARLGYYDCEMYTLFSEGLKNYLKNIGYSITEIYDTTNNCKKTKISWSNATTGP